MFGAGHPDSDDIVGSVLVNMLPVLVHLGLDTGFRAPWRLQHLVD